MNGLFELHSISSEGNTKMPYLDRLNVSGQISRQKSEENWRRLLVQPISVPSLEHTHVSASSIVGEVAQFTRPDGSVSSQTREMIRSNARYSNSGDATKMTNHVKMQRVGENSQQEVSKKSVHHMAKDESSTNSTTTKHGAKKKIQQGKFVKKGASMDAVGGRPCFRCLLDFQYGRTTGTQPHRHFDRQVSEYAHLISKSSESSKQ